MDLGLDAITQGLGNADDIGSDSMSFELLGTEIEYNQASDEFTFAVESLEQCDIVHGNILQLMAAVEQFDVAAVVEVIGEKEFIGLAGSVANKEVALEGLGNRASLLWKSILDFIKKMWAAFINFCKRFIAVFSGEKVVVAKLVELASEMDKDKTSATKINSSTVEVAAPPMKQLIDSMDGVETLGVKLATLEGKTSDEIVAAIEPIVAKMDATVSVQNGVVVITDNAEVGGGAKRLLKDIGIDTSTIKHAAESASKLFVAVDQGFGKMLGSNTINHVDADIARAADDAAKIAALKASRASTTSLTKIGGFLARKARSTIVHLKVIDKAVHEVLTGKITGIKMDDASKGV